MLKSPHPAGSAFADRTAAELAVELMLPMINAGLQSKTLGDSGFLYIVVMDPALRPEHCPFEDAILYEHAVGDTAAWDADYGEYAREKARVAWMNKCNGHEVRACSPHYLRKSDTGVWGGIWLDGIAVGVSGAFPWFDEAIGTGIAASLRAVAKQRALSTPESLWIS